MLTPSITIQKKRDGEELSADEIREFIRGIHNGAVTDYQASAFLMATYFQGMSMEETIALTESMLQSGDRYDLSRIPGSKIDKHSTGGVGDKVSLILAPLAAACGLKVPMMSGRGLGHSGGTLDKLESIPGFDVRISRERFEAVLSQVGCAMIGQSERIAPVDRKLYAIRDVTATVECVPLIVASILSKKLAEGANGLVLDVKVGSGAFMKTREHARKLAKALVFVARKMHLPCRAILTDMSQPLGYAVGNRLEVMECVEIMQNRKSQQDLSSADLRELTIHLCAQMLELGRIAKSIEQGRKLAHARLADGSAWKKFVELVEAQGGSVQELEKAAADQSRLKIVQWKAKKRGYVSKMNTETLGRILVELGGGRKKVADSIDPSVGMVFHRKLGARVQSGETLVTVYAQPATNLAPLEEMFQDAVLVTSTRKSVPKLVFERI